ncbi:hypothetical protein CAEBREN_23124 [Caenorhabditis brenneri]|uniref:F-box domain-containing protein n=1 Tax=Caenorhabditis brenneri TaxID=135651 RepID=G0P5F0_CAEBE|nr:hypothetical protein CAEBREN_23124 [Caenorhabditis brenneri]
MDDIVVSTFPLLNLPINAILNTFRTMDPVQVFGVSILSKKTKNLVESFKITPEMLQVEVAEMFVINFILPSDTTFYFELYQVPENQPLLELGTPETIHIHCNSQVMVWTNSMNVKQLLDHLRIIFHRPIDKLFFEENCERFSLESIHKNVTDVVMINIFSGNHEHNRRILSLFQPAALCLVEHALVDQCVPRDILMQNFDLFHVPDVQIILDDLLMTNSRFILLFCLRLSWKTLNQFLKLWVKGSNLRLEYLFLRFPDNLGLDELFNGLKYQDAPPKRELLKAYGGRDIWRFDGTQATISTDIRDDLVSFRMFVWHDHRVVN